MTELRHATRAYLSFADFREREIPAILRWMETDELANDHGHAIRMFLRGLEPGEKSAFLAAVSEYRERPEINERQLDLLNVLHRDILEEG